MSNFRNSMLMMDAPGTPEAPTSEHDLEVGYAKLLVARRNRKLAEQHAEFVYETARRAPLDVVESMWEKALGTPGNPDFALAVARAAPVLLTRGDERDVARIYELLSATLDHVPDDDKLKAAEALLRAVVRVHGPVPPKARTVIRAHRNTLQRYPDVWRLIGTFAG